VLALVIPRKPGRDELTAEEPDQLMPRAEAA